MALGPGVRIFSDWRVIECITGAATGGRAGLEEVYPGNRSREIHSAKLSSVGIY